MSESIVATHYIDSDPDTIEENSKHPTQPVMHRIVHDMNRKFLTGSDATGFTARFQEGLGELCMGKKELIGDNWVLEEDLYTFFRHDLTSTVINAVFGTSILKLNPTFLADFWTFSDNLTVFMVRVPRCLAWRVYNARDRLLSGMKKWQEWANTQSNNVEMDKYGDEICWGSSFFKERYDIMSRLKGFDPVSMAAQELSFLYALNANAIIATFWCALEVFKNPSLLEAVREEVQSCTIPNQPLKFDTQRLLNMPHLQAIYAETLRIRGHGVFIRKADRDVQFHDHVVQKGTITISSSTPGHFNPDVWSKNQYPPVDVFWAGRFLKQDGDKVQFSKGGVEGSWLPFGGGWNMCPGKRFAKLQAIVTVAMLVTQFDIDVLASGRGIKMSMKSFGVGILGPSGKVPVRIRRRSNGTT
ncbi:cytochrome P450 [Massarina eburnea CBS 473.64]|uniref:Cytochrome P450 n=1 Tax=Massarina eburnea CBS 473.64 TaxID=1395130 RepID=A0A6A6S758_9PLEO|nr:cytochrome P450 [Massarina eburnea CBS 473.64]